MKNVIIWCILTSFLNGGAEPPAEPSWVVPAENIEIGDMNLYWQHDSLYFDADPDATLSIYVEADQGEDGELLFDDGQDWLVVMETAMGEYPLFARQYVQLGGVSCAVFQETIDGETAFHVLITVQQTAGYEIYDCVFDGSRSAFQVTPVYAAKGINFITESKR